jgi:hypothetical protein
MVGCGFDRTFLREGHNNATRAPKPHHINRSPPAGPMDSIKHGHEQLIDLNAGNRTGGYIDLSKDFRPKGKTEHEESWVYPEIRVKNRIKTLLTLLASIALIIYAVYIFKHRLSGMLPGDWKLYLLIGSFIFLRSAIKSEGFSRDYLPWTSRHMTHRR